MLSTTTILIAWLILSVVLGAIALHGLKKLWAWDDKRRSKAKRIEKYETRKGIKLEK